MRAGGHTRLGRGEDRGTAVVIFGVSAMLLIVVAALAIDLSHLRADRRVDQKVIDAAVTAGALELPGGHGRGACEAALDYLEANTEDVSSFSGADCSGFPDFVCDPSVSTSTTSGTAGGYRVEIVYPVADDHPMMERVSSIGSDPVNVSTSDGSRCERFGVSMAYSRRLSFGGALGNADQTTEVHGVAKPYGLIPPELPINLLILERERCRAIEADGNPTLVVGAMTGVNGETLPGILAVDSNGSADNCTGTDTVGTLHAQGSKAYIRADGPTGCPAELSVDPQTGDDVSGQGQGCGFLELFAPGVPGPASPLYCEDDAYRPACTSTAWVRPHPNRMAERRTRAPVDYAFNCKAGYDNSPWFGNQPIDGCDGATSDTDYVDELFSFVSGTSTPSGFDVYGDDADEPCIVDGNSTITVPEGNTLVTCTPFEVKREVVFEGGNVIFGGDVIVTSKGDLTIHACGEEGVNNCNPADPIDWSAGENFTEQQYTSDAAWTAFRKGSGLHKDAGGAVRIHDTTVFLPRDADTPDTDTEQALSIAGGSGTLEWYAPREGPFDVLSMWSDAVNDHDLGGQAVIEMEGVYFAPVAHLTYRGTGGQDQVSAQLIVRTLSVSGDGELEVTPDIHRSLTHDTPEDSTLIR